MQEWDEFEWDKHNEDHIAKHGVDRYEAEDAATESKAILRRVGTSRYGHRRYACLGKTEDGRILVVIVDRKSPSLVRVATAMDASFTDKRAYRKQKR